MKSGVEILSTIPGERGSGMEILCRGGESFGVTRSGGTWRTTGNGGR